MQLFVWTQTIFKWGDIHDHTSVVQQKRGWWVHVELIHIELNENYWRMTHRQPSTVILSASVPYTTVRVEIFESSNFCRFGKRLLFKKFCGINFCWPWCNCARSLVRQWIYQAIYMASTPLCTSLSLTRGYNAYDVWLLSLCRWAVLPFKAQKCLSRITARQLDHVNCEYTEAAVLATGAFVGAESDTVGGTVDRRWYTGSSFPWKRWSVKVRRRDSFPLSR